MNSPTHFLFLQGLLLVGFTPEEAVRTQAWLAEVEAELPVVALPGGGALSAPTAALRDALECLDGAPSRPNNSAALAEDDALLGGAPVVIFSGLSGVEVEGVVEAWAPCTGALPPSVPSIPRRTEDNKLACSTLYHATA